MKSKNICSFHIELCLRKEITTEKEYYGLLDDFDTRMCRGLAVGLGVTNLDVRPEKRVNFILIFSKM